ncbi:ABC transporter substrate-binding protein [Microbacterium kribbense]|uniref:ABC transporter substrate-binding protein n=1 Tax=Microbacterium kribbense TaxID=433645 RepID=UPI0031CE20EB
MPFTFLSFLPLTSFTVSPEMLADLDGTFKKDGLDATLQPVKGSAQATQLLLANKGQVARNGLIDAMVAAFAQNQPVVVTGIDTYQTGIKIVTTSKTPNPADWVGKTMGVPSVNGTSDKTLSMSLIEAGLDPKSVKRQLVGLSAGTFDLVQKGTLVGYLVSTDTAFLVAKQNPDAHVFTPTTGSGINIYMSTKDQIQQNGDALKKYFAAITEVKSGIVNGTDQDYTKAIDTLRTKYSWAALDDSTIAVEAFKAQVGLWKNPAGAIGQPDMDAIDKSYQELVKAGFVPGGKKIESLFDTSLLPQ